RGRLPGDGRRRRPQNPLSTAKGPVRLTDPFVTCCSELVDVRLRVAVAALVLLAGAARAGRVARSPGVLELAVLDRVLVPRDLVVTVDGGRGARQPLRAALVARAVGAQTRRVPRPRRVLEPLVVAALGPAGE